MNYLQLIRTLPCALCEVRGVEQTSKTDAHHIRFDYGASQRADDILTIPLCHDTCHQGPHGRHGDQALFRLANVTEMDLLAKTLWKVRGVEVQRARDRKRLSRQIPSRVSPSRPAKPSRTASPEKSLPRAIA